MFDRLKRIFAPQQPLPFKVLFKKFQEILERNNRILEIMADMGDKLGGEYVFDRKYIVDASEELADQVYKLISDLSVFSQRRNVELFVAFERIREQIQEELGGHPKFPDIGPVLPMDKLGADCTEEAGSKMATLGDIRNHLSLSTPQGFVITAKAFLDFMTANDLLRLAEEGVAKLAGNGSAVPEVLCEEMRRGIMEAPMPRHIVTHINRQLDALAATNGGRDLRLAVRSSARGEDGDSSFAGQYESVLNVPGEGVIKAYRRVMASAYSPEAWRYRRHRGWREHEMLMAVGCLSMVRGRVSGVAHSYAPEGEDGALQTSALWGLCAPVVGGDVQADTFVMARTAPYAMLRQRIVDKPRRMVCHPEAGVSWQKLPEEFRRVPCLSDERRRELAQAVMSLERFYKRPQEVEWTFDDAGTLHILQSRALQFRTPRSACVTVDNATRGAEIIFSGRGQAAQCGVAVGKVVKVHHDADLDDFPHGGILAARYSSPRFSQVMRRAQGVITDVGSPMGHMATIAREYRVPTLVNVEGGVDLLEDGEEITLDATQNVVYRGRIAELDNFELTESDVFEESYEYRVLKRLLGHMSPLNLVDPHSDDFKPSACRTYHDIARYVHERSVERLVHLNDDQGACTLAPALRLKSDIPLDLVVVDVSGSMETEPKATSVSPEQLTSVPLIEFMRGLEGSGMWCTEPVSVDLGSFMSSFTRTFSPASARTMGRNLAVVLEEYMNMHLHLGYHYTIIDSCISETVNDNYAYFRFLGGVTELIRRSRRARFIAQVLEHFDFRVEVHGDLVVGRIKKLSRYRMGRRMRMLGGLVAYTRQLDARMHSDQDVLDHVERFIDVISPVIGPVGSPSGIPDHVLRDGGDSPINGG